MGSNVSQLTTTRSVDVYRSVSLAEYQDILKNGFGSGGSSYTTGKLFALNVADAKFYNSQFGNSLIVKARIPAGTLIEQIFGVDGLTSIYNVPISALDKVRYLTVFKY